MECVDVISTTNTGVGVGGGVVQTIINGYPMWNHNVQSVPDVPREVVRAAGYYGVQPVSDEDIVAIGNKRGRDGGSGSSSDYGPKSFTRGLLTNAQRSELHSEIYNYFVWLRSQVKAESSGGSGKKSVNGMSSDSLKEMLKCMDAALPSAKSGGSVSAASGGGARSDDQYMTINRIIAKVASNPITSSSSYCVVLLLLLLSNPPIQPYLDLYWCYDGLEWCFGIVSSSSIDW